MIGPVSGLRIDRERDALVIAHDREFTLFVETGDLVHFHAARAIAARIVECGKSMQAWNYVEPYAKMYPELK